jgi:NADPH-dependent ferric siderophore reductase
MGFSSASVAEITPLSRRLSRVVLKAPELDRLELPDCADAAVGIYFPTTDPERPPPPMQCRNGVWGFYDGDSAPSGRTYTVRHCDRAAHQITVDFVLHGQGVGTDWLQRAAPGHHVVLAHPNSWYRPSSTTAWRLLAADLAGLPALVRIIVDLSPDARTLVIAEVIDRSDLDYLPAKAHVSMISSVGTGNGVADSVLAQLVADQRLPQDGGYCWVGAEASQARAIRKYLRIERCWRPDQLDILGYWRRHSESWDGRYAQVGPELFSIFQQALAAGKTEKVAQEEFDAALERAGL